jgi:hypothetical protein
MIAITLLVTPVAPDRHLVVRGRATGPDPGERGIALEVCRLGEPLPRLHSRKGQWLLALLTLRHGRIVDWA